MILVISTVLSFTMSSVNTLTRFAHLALMAFLVASHAAAAPVGLAPASAGASLADHRGAITGVLDLKALPGLDSIIPRLARKRVVFIGEAHDQYGHHLNQLAIIRRLHARHPDLAIGMEFFQQPFQQELDDYIAGKLDERELLKKTEYYKRWRFDFRLYAPILRYARQHHIPVVALNLPMEITRQVGREGPDSLSESQKAQIPAQIDRTDHVYRERLQNIYDSHPKRDGANFDNFLEVQLLWDEGMAERAAQYLKQHPGRRLVVLAGSGHLAYGVGIPQRLTRRINVGTAIVLQGVEGSIEPDMADYLLLPEKHALPPPGRLGVVLANTDDGVRARAFSPGSAAAAAGIKRGDRILALDGVPVAENADIKVALWDKRPGDTVAVEVRRRRWLRADATLAFEIELGEPAAAHH